jgi:hypothetical protein
MKIERALLEIKQELNIHDDNQERNIILEMLLWKNNTDPIPSSILIKLIENKFLKETEDKEGYEWTQIAIKISHFFNKKFSYEI